MSRAGIFHTTCHITSDGPHPIGPNVTLHASELPPHADIAWLVQTGALVPVTPPALMTLYTDDLTAEQWAAEVEKLQRVCEEQAELIDRQAAELVTLRGGTPATPATPTRAVPAPAETGPHPSIGSDKSGANPRYKPQPPKPAPRRGMRFADSQPAILPIPGQPIDAASASVNAAMGVSAPPPAPVLGVPHATDAAVASLADELAGAREKLAAERRKTDAEREARLALERRFAEMEAKVARLAAPPAAELGILDLQPTT